MRRAVSFFAVSAAAWAALAGRALLESLDLLGPGASTLCPVRLLTGWRCPGCGMCHAIVAAMRGDFSGSWAHHPLGLPLLVLWTAWLVREGGLLRRREFPEVVFSPLATWAALAGVLAVHAARVAAKMG